MELQWIRENMETEQILSARPTQAVVETEVALPGGLREEARVFSAQGRMSGIVIGMLPVAVTLFLMILNPTYLTEFVANPLGKFMLILSVLLEGTGFFLINRIVDIKY